MGSSTVLLATLVAIAQADKTERTFSVLRFVQNKALLEGRIDPVNTPGQISGHVHTVFGGSNMGISATGESLMSSSCSGALISGDNSGYWVPKLYFLDASGTVEPVELSYFNVYYFFEPTDDTIVPFPVGLQMHVGDLAARTCPDNGGQVNLNPSDNATIQPVQWTCPRSNYDPPSWPSAAASDGTTQGIQDPDNAQAGQGFPDAHCDGYGSPLRQDVHFPSCYDPSKALTDHKHNMAYPTTAPGPVPKQNCPDGFLHVPHLLFETYWETPAFADRWTAFQGQQPFVLANGDASGCSAHGDFIAAWDPDVLQHVIDTCNAGDIGMDHCDGVTVRSEPCTAESPVPEQIYGVLAALPGDNPIGSWGREGDYSDGASVARRGAVRRSRAVASAAP